MNLPVFTTLLVSGLCSLSSSVPRQFHVVKEQKTWAEAQQYCREEFTDLATIDDMTEMEKLKSLIQEAGAERFWIGLKKGSSPKWQWSLADVGFYRVNEAEFRNWGQNQTNGQGPKGQSEDVNCVIQTENGGWNDYGCSETLLFICYDEENPTHPFVLVDEGKTWADAQRYCRENHTDLVSVRNQTENNQIDEVKEDKKVWIGLFKAWKWSDGSSSSFRHWRSGEPNNAGEACTEIRAGDLWNDLGCQSEINSICYEDKLVLVHENKTWAEALQYCRDHKMDLVSVRSERIQRWVNQWAKGASTAHVWLGLRHSCGVGWFWVYGETVCYDNWAQGQERVQDCTERVGAVKAGGDGGQEEGQWVSLPETETLNFICTTEE